MNALLWVRDHILAAAGPGKRDYADRRVSLPLERMMESRSPYAYNGHPEDAVFPCEESARHILAAAPTTSPAARMGAAARMCRAHSGGGGRGGRGADPQRGQAHSPLGSDDQMHRGGLRLFGGQLCALRRVCRGSDKNSRYSKNARSRCFPKPEALPHAFVVCGNALPPRNLGFPSRGRPHLLDLRPRHQARPRISSISARLRAK